MAEEMYGIVSVLDEEHQIAVWELWADIEREFGVKISETHVPHFSYHVATSYGPSLNETLAAIAASTSSRANSIVLHRCLQRTTTAVLLAACADGRPEHASPALVDRTRTNCD